MNRAISKERLAAFSDGVFAVIITIMVLALKLPPHPTFSALIEEWPAGLSYAVSYLLIAIMWINHHFLLRFAKDSTPRIILWSFVHMFPASLVPFATAWVAESRFAPVPVFIYAFVIVLVNLAYHAFMYDVVPRMPADDAAQAARQRALIRSYVTLALFAFAMVLALKYPLAAFSLVTLVLITYSHPETPGAPHQTMPSDRSAER